MKKETRKLEYMGTILIVVAALLILGAHTLISNSNEKHQKKQIKIEVIYDDQDYRNVYKLTTEERTLGKALDSMNIAQYEDSTYGRYVVAVDGIKANDSKKQWWKILVDNDLSQLGIDDLKIKDGRTYTFTFCEGYDK